ncbi:NepR family anti-sigma factor [Croceicoccus bisphenolivorans]|uniref:NepR family anti-sigma factor n=1 Tax=Croceicoccus bisphenolivorans TaxID=1783232 RepID=UPI00082D0D20|nr:NepR family anti-sigma factor [Croceicoccus bisphenolivorans]
MARFVPFFVQGIIFKRQRALAAGPANETIGWQGVAVLASADRRMRDVKKKDEDTQRPKKTGKRPEWAAGLRQLYDSVVEEPLPDSFSDLLSKLDSDD